MKNASLAILASVMVLSGLSQAQASCRKDYQNLITQIEATEKGGMESGGGVIVIGLLMGMAESGPALLTTAAGGLTMAGYKTMAAYKLHQANYIIRVLDQAKIGIGVELDELAQDLKSSLPVVAAAVNQLDEVGAFCQDNQLLDSGDFSKVVGLKISTAQ